MVIIWNIPMNQPGKTAWNHVDIASKGPRSPGPPGSPGGIHEEGLPRDGGRASRGGSQQRGPLVELTRPGKYTQNELENHPFSWENMGKSPILMGKYGKITHFNGKIWEKSTIITHFNGKIWGKSTISTGPWLQSLFVCLPEGNWVYHWMWMYSK